MATTPHVRIGVVSYDTPTYLDDCLRHLAAAIEGLDAEVVVVDNGSVGEADAEVARRYPVRLVRLGRNVGYPRAMNVALSGSDATYLIAVNSDTLPEPRSLTRLVETLERRPDVGIVSPRLVGPDRRLQHSVRSFPSSTVALQTGLVPPPLRVGRMGARMLLENELPLDRPSEADWIVGAVHVIRAAALRRSQPYSERSFMFVEDMEVCWHVREGGWRVLYDPSVTVVHVGNVTAGKSFGGGREFRWIDAMYHWYVDQHGLRAARRWAAANTVGLLAKAAALRIKGTPEHRAYVDGLARFHRGRLRQPLGDHSSLASPDGRSGDQLRPVVVADTGAGRRWTDDATTPTERPAPPDPRPTRDGCA